VTDDDDAVVVLRGVIVVLVQAPEKFEGLRAYRMSRTNIARGRAQIPSCIADIVKAERPGGRADDAGDDISHDSDAHDAHRVRAVDEGD
jgi:hypothetical protein